ncbi:Spo0E family sporulation regulatory protein-aspartic acid phosphatase [Paenibacillus alvei]|uniref:Spo0E family sporulation regulatory protein-aspartic acid phosphatase n=1 Tax=Paenibacillus alvei TaxID=44250 RepID=A0AAP6ZY35_PAEAL|nr:Spo0E family sporulation regulatory protein-aspartic acid phosphatase [Paenibacillus alvei]NOJ72135.1 Spo0E family sporulation regulatory protein-aspartic acid phosphatase [Paenibacillus alvei]
MRAVKSTKQNLGVLIRRYRYELNMTQQDLAKISGVHRKLISILEYGGTPRDYASLGSIFTALNIPAHEVVTALATTKIHSDIWLGLLQQLVSAEGDISLARDVMVLVLACKDESTEARLGKLMSVVQQGSGSIEHRLALMDYAIAQAQMRGMDTYVAKGKYYRYLVERDNFSKMAETYLSGKKVLPYAEFLSCDERIILYYKLGVHAYTLHFYKESIEFSKLLLDSDGKDSTYKAYSILLISSSYFKKSNYELAEQYLARIRLTRFPFLKDHVAFMKAKLYEKRGDVESAIFQLQLCLKSSVYKLNIVNSLLHIYLQKRDMDAAQQLLLLEPDYLEEDFTNPIKINELSNYYINKGKLLSGMNRQKEAIDFFKKGITMFTRLTDTDEALLRQMEQTRLNMISAVEAGRNLTDASVVRLSQELDGYIVEIQKKSILKRLSLPN